jgi:putative toxin-antitoxin system antitoxin component (TIGR02293 family)
MAGNMEKALLKLKARDEPPDMEVYWKVLQAAGKVPTHPYVDFPGHQYVSLIGLKESDPLEIAKTIRKGLKFKSLELFLAKTLFSTADLANFVSIPERTLYRRKQQGRLDPEESDRLVRATRVFAKALALFEGDIGAARNWLQTPARAFKGEQPINVARTEVGSREVEALIDRLEQGVLT